MNAKLHRLVFSRRLGMPVAVAEGTRGRRKAGAGARRRAAALAAALAAAALWPAAAQTTRPPVSFGSRLPAPSAPLPVPYGAAGGPNAATPRAFAYDPAKGAPTNFNTGTQRFDGDLQASGAVSWKVEGNKGTFDQGAVPRVVINWDSFNIGAGFSVEFRQDRDPSKYVSALNRIWSADPSVILGSLKADREVVLLNANGVYFGRGARVDTGKFVATALNIADKVFDAGLRNVTDGSAVFTGAATDGYAATNPDAAVSVEAGAELRSAAGGAVLLFAPRVVNQGRIETPQGQAVLAAGDKVYLMSSTDPAQRGLIVAVDPVLAGSQPDPTLGVVENAASGSYKTVGGQTVDEATPDNTAGLVKKLNEIRTESGTVNLVGLTVRQNGVINATTAVKGANGAIYLQAMRSTVALPAGAATTLDSAGSRGLGIESTGRVRVGAELGTVSLGPDSRTQVLPDAGAATQIDDEQFNPSRIRAEGRSIVVESGAKVLAPGGQIEMLSAASTPRNPLFDAAQSELAVIGDGSRTVVEAGAVVSAAGLAEVPVDGARNQGSLRLFRIELADAPVQRGGVLYRSQVYFDLRDARSITTANVTGAPASIGRTASEKSTAGGSVRLESEGAVVLGDGALVDVSGGSVRYSSASIQNSLVTRDGRVLAFGKAGSGTALDALLETPQRALAPGYVEGHDGGNLRIVGHQLALGGASLKGTVTLGERQRNGLDGPAVPAQLTIGRNLNSVGYLGTLKLDPARSSAADPAFFDDPQAASLNLLPAEASLSLRSLGDSGFGRISLRAAEIRQPAFGSLELAPGSSLSLLAGGSIQLDGRFLAPGGTIGLQSVTGDIGLSAGTRLDVAGRWTNDTAGATLVAEGGRPLPQLDGGSITLAAARTAELRAGAVLDVSAGASLGGSGTLKQGKAGSIAIAALGYAGAAAGLGSLSGVGLRGFDFAAGGSLSIAGPALGIGTDPASGFTLAPGFFSEHGFGTIAVNAAGDVTLASGTRLAPRLLNWQLTEGYKAAPSGAMDAAVATPVALDTALFDRRPVNLAFAALKQQIAGVPIQPLSSLRIERGAGIELEPGGRLQLSATRNLEIGASGGTEGQASTLVARGGSIALSITGARGNDGDASQDLYGFLGDQALWLGKGAQLDASGIAQLRPEGGTRLASAGGVGGEARIAGQVLGGGSISLLASRGYVVAEAGSSIRLDGAAGELSVAGSPGKALLAKPGGTLVVSSREGFALDGQVSMAAPADAAGRALADGGRLELNLALGGNETGTQGRVPYPDAGAAGTRVLDIGDHDGLLAGRGARYGGNLAASLGNGVGYVRASMLATAGAARLSLGAGDRVRFGRSLALELPLGLLVDAPAVEAAPGVQVSVTAGIAQLGDAQPTHLGAAPDRGAAADASAAGDTNLRILAPMIDLVGSWGLRGFSSVVLDAGSSADGTIRLRTAGTGELNSETLAFAGTLDLGGLVSAARPNRPLAYAIRGLAATSESDTGSTLRIRTGAAGALAPAPLSAFGAMSFAATTIEQLGVLRQPFGSITLSAERLLRLGDSSITSVSGQGLSVPFGQTLNLASWEVAGDTAAGLPQAKGIALSGKTIVSASGALVDAQGGGSVLAREFFPGVGGTQDYFATAGLYAVLPDLGASTGELGRQIVITTPGSGLAPGRYTLQPAELALAGGSLPQGAFLVSRAGGTGLLSQPLRRDDGSSVVNGYFTEAGSINQALPTERFLVEPGATYRARSDIRLTDVSQLLADRAALLGATTVPPLPRDAGLVQLTAGGSEGSIWNARLALRADGGRAGLLDISATRLALVDDPDKVPAGAFGVLADAISASGAGSVLLGGRRSQASAGDATNLPAWTIDQSATRTVDVDIGDKTLQVEELLLAGTSRVTLAPGTHLQAGTTATVGARSLLPAGDGALLAVSADTLELRRSGAAGATGELQIGAGSVLAARQVTADASARLSMDGTTQILAPQLDLGAQRLVLGAGAPADETASVLTGDLLALARTTPSLSLRAYGSIDFVGAHDWAQRSGDTPANVGQALVLDAPLVRGLAAAEGGAARVDIAAQSIALLNTSGRAPDPKLATTGSLTLQALPSLRYGQTGGLSVGPGEMRLGFDTASLRSGGDIVLRGSDKLAAAADLSLSAARLTAATGASPTVRAGGRLVVAVEPGSRTLGETVGVGAEMLLTAATIRQLGVVDLPGGNLSLSAEGPDPAGVALAFGAGSVTSVAGFTLRSPQGFDAEGLPGRITATAGNGRIELLGTLDAHAAGSGDGGRITLSAAGSGGLLVLGDAGAQGRLLGSGGSGGWGGQLTVDVSAMAAADGLAAAAGAGGFTRSVELRVRSGPLALDHDLQAQRILIAADGGDLALGNTTLNAAAPAGGLVQLAAGGNLSLADGTYIDARSLRAGANGGDVLLASRGGRVQIGAQATVDAGGDEAADGRIVLRATRGTNSVAVDRIDTSRLKAGELDIEAVRTYTGVTTLSGGTTSPSGTLTQATIRSNDNAFIANKAAVLAALGVPAAESASGRVNLRAGTEVQSAGNLAVSGDWTFAGTTASPNLDRPGGDAGFLSLRAAGNLLVNGSLSDGFSTATLAGLLNDNERSWSFRLAAGADLTGANPLAVRDLSAGGSGDLLVAAGKLVRTGGGSIEMAAGRDIGFLGSSSAGLGEAYVAGRKSSEQAGVLSALFSGQGAKPTITEQGGRLELDARRDISSAEATQLVNNWLWRTGNLQASGLYATSSQLGWWTEFSRFRQTLGSFGGGNVSVRAGQDIVNLQAMAPTVAWADSRVAAAATLQVRNGGDLTVSAGRHLLGGQFLLGRGQGRLRAGTDLGAAGSNTRAKLPLLALLDGQWDLAARRDAALGSAFDPTAFTVVNTVPNDQRGTVSSYFYSWGGDAGLSLHATAGALRLGRELTPVQLTSYGLNFNAGDALLQLMPPTLKASATGGDLVFTGSSDSVLFPSASGGLEFWAAGNLGLNSTLAMAGTSPAAWPDFRRALTAGAALGALTNPNSGTIANTLGNALKGTDLHAADPDPVRLYAGGSISTPGLATLIVPKRAEVEAGLDLLGLRFIGQNMQAADATTLRAGRNLLAGLTGRIELGGPGSLQIQAGRQVDLGSSAGITTTGNLGNPSLAEPGASVRLAAATAGTLDPDVLAGAYLDPASNPRGQGYRELLLAYVRDALRQPSLGYEQAWAQFKTFPTAAQAAFGRQVLAAEFGAVYLSGSTPDEQALRASLRETFERHKAHVLEAGAAALAAGGSLTLPGREVLEGAALENYLDGLRALSFASVDIDAAVAARAASLKSVDAGWREAVAASLGGSVQGLDALRQSDPASAQAQAWAAALKDFSGPRFEAYRAKVLAGELASVGATASLYGRKSLPMRLALFDEGFRAAELAGVGSFVEQPIWNGARPLFAYTGSLDMTNSSLITQRGGDIDLVNPGGPINVGLKSASGGVIALGGGNVFGLARDDFQVNTQRVFVVGLGDMTIWSSAGDIDSGRGANTAVGAPALVARRVLDGVLFEVPATTTGSGLGILEDSAGRRNGTIGLYPAFGEIRALDAFIRAPSVVLGSTIRGADNLLAASVGGAAAPVAAPSLAVAAPPVSTESKAAPAAGGETGGAARQRNSLLTVELLGLGGAEPEPACSDEDERAGKCKRPPRCTDEQRAAGTCK